MNRRPTPTGLPAHRFPVEPWRLVETEYRTEDLGHTETLFAVGNGYLGMRANPEEGRDAHSHGTYVNGFHETWPIQHAENAYGFATTGQTIVNVPDAKLLKLYVDDEPLLLSDADLLEYERARRLPRRPSDSRPHLVDPCGQTGAGLVVADGEFRPPAPGRDDLRRHPSRRSRSDRHLVTAHEPPGRRGRVPRPVRCARRGYGSTEGEQVQPSRVAASAPTGRRRTGRRRHPRLPLHQQPDDPCLRVPSPDQHGL